MKLNKLAFGIVLSLGAIGSACAESSEHHREIKTIKIVAFNDFHGQLESPGSLRQTPTSPSATNVPVGGVDWMAGAEIHGSGAVAK